MDCVMINQLPELIIPRNRTFAPSRAMTVATETPERRNPYITKWYVLFDNKCDQWISFQPQIGHIVYPCYACRDMFGSRSSFLDHVNRRGMICKYKCPSCKQQKTFYNPCSFLLHCRDHFSEPGGQIDLDDVEISTIPMNIAGFLPLPTIPLIYDTEDDTVNPNLNLNIKFYKANDNCIGQRLVDFSPNDLIFFCTLNNNTTNSDALIIKQVNHKIPKCIFVSVFTTPNNVVKIVDTPGDSSQTDCITLEDDSELICLDDEENHVTEQDIKPVIHLKNLNTLLDEQNPNNSSESENEGDVCPNCPECNKPQRIILEHFQEISQPTEDNYRCKICGLIATSFCSLRAHIRIHDKRPPFVCPECGTDFDSWDDLEEHLDNNCFHTAKIVRYKCPAKKCGKVFAQNVTFSAHFPVAHMKVRFACSACSRYFPTEIDFGFHLDSHKNESDIQSTRIHECTVCCLPAEDIKKHVLNHVNNKDNRIFVYICRYCRSCYRSKQTYSTHLVKCTKLILNTQVKRELQRSEMQKIELQDDSKCKVLKYCKPCNTRVHFNCTYRELKFMSNRCPKCSLPFSNAITYKSRPYSEYVYTSNNFVVKNIQNVFFCILCNAPLENCDDKLISYDKHSCKYENPVVLIKKLSNQKNSQMIKNLDPERQIDDSAKRKRKRLLNGSFKSKTNSPEKFVEDILPVVPEPFDGEYKCKCCVFRTTSRESFHEHIQQHRDVSTSYQCMECGECFVVKPSLIKHLQVFHLVEDIDSYMVENECFDKEAVRMLEESMRMVPGEGKEPVAENQCRICRQMFTDSVELSKHFRVHGMAFLMKKVK